MRRTGWVVCLAIFCLAPSAAWAHARTHHHRHHRRRHLATARARGSKPVNTSAPVLSGSAVQGATITTSSGGWSGSPTSYSYSWQDCGGGTCWAIAGASGSSYKLGSGDVGRSVKAVVTAKNAFGSGSAASAPSAVVTAPTTGGSGALNGLYVSGSSLVNGSGAVVHLHGVNRSGSEYACIQGWGLFDGPSDAASVAAMAAWHINIVRIPLNEDCWLGLGGVNPAYSGANYVNAIVSYVNLLHSYGIYAELSLMWAAPAGQLATYQSAAPDEDHSPAMWASMAQTFKNDPNVILAPWGETYVDWSCFMNGCNNQASWGTGPIDGDTPCTDSTGTPISGCWHYTTAGLNQAVQLMRGAGYGGPIAIPCIQYANVCADPSSGGSYAGGTWVTEHPADPDHALVAELHVYGKNICDTPACMTTTVGPILAAGYPAIFGETGETYDASDCGTSYIAPLLNWADANNVGYEAWAWDTWGNCLSLVSNYDGTPGNAYASYIQSHYLSLP